MRIRISKTVYISVLLIAILLSLLSCSSKPQSIPNLVTSYTKYASARSIPLDTSSVDNFSFTNVNLCGEDIVVLSRLGEVCQLIFYDRRGNVLSTSGQIPIGPQYIIYEVFSPTPDQICIVSGIEKMNETQDGFVYGDICLQTIDRKGTPLKDTVVIPNQLADLQPMVVGSANGDVYIAGDKNVTIYHPNGSKVFRNDYQRSIRLSSIGTIPAVESDSRYLPVTAGITDFSHAVDVQPSSAAEPADSVDGLFFYNSAGIFAYDFAKQEEVLVFRWNDSDFDYTYASSRTAVLTRDLYFVMQYALDGSETITLIQASLDAPATETVDGKTKTVITIAGCGIIQEPMSESSYLMTACRTYQEAHPDVEIKVIDYLNEYGYDQGTTQLCLDILTNNAADLYFYTPYDFNVEEEVAFMDLSSIIASDPEFSTADYYWNIVEDTRIDGKLYSLPLAFDVGVMYGPESLLADIDTWTITDFMALDDTLPEGFTLTAGGRPSQDLAYYMSCSIDNFIDPTTGEVDLENDAFYDALAYSQRFALYDEASSERLHNKTFVLSEYGIDSIQSYAEIFLSSKEPQVIIGRPEDNGILQSSIDHCMSISASSESPDIAWDVLKFFLSEDMQTMTLGHFETYVYGIPLNRNAAIWQIDWFGRNDDANTINEYEPYREEYLALVNSISSVRHDNSSVYSIVEEEAPYYFLGQKSAEDLAKVLESRINLMLAENS